MAGEDERLRDAFAQLLAMGQDRSAPVEALWAAQGQRQLPPTPSAPGMMMDRSETAGNFEPPGTVTPQVQISPEAEQYARQAMPGLGRTDNPWSVADEPGPAPFGGKGLIIRPGDEEYALPPSKNYALPKKEKKNKKKGKD
jgi:hypothetical protein